MCACFAKTKNILPQNGTGDLRPSSMDGPSSNIAGHSQIIIQIFHFWKKKKVKTTKNESHNDNGAKIMNNQKQDH